MKHLLDASALLLLIKKSTVKSTIQLLKDSAILDLTFYEIGNAIWKETTLKYLTEEGAEKLAPLAQIVLTRMNRVTGTAEDFPAILQIAQTEKLTYYDSSYIHFAKKSATTLVTEDQELASKATKYVDVLKTADFP